MIVENMLNEMVFVAKQKEMLDPEYCSVVDISLALDNRYDEGYEFGNELRMFLERKLDLNKLDFSLNYDSKEMIITFKEEEYDDFFNYGYSNSKIVLIKNGDKLEIKSYTCFSSIKEKIQNLLDSEDSESIVSFYDYWFKSRNEENNQCVFGKEIVNANLKEVDFCFNIKNGILSLYYVQDISPIYHPEYKHISLDRTGIMPELTDGRLKENYYKNYSACFNKAYVRINSLPRYLRESVTEIRNKHILDKQSAPQKKIGIR